MAVTEAQYDEAIRMRMAGMSYDAMARSMGLSYASSAQHRYRQARALQIPPEFQPRRHATPPLPFLCWAAGFLDGEGCIYGYETRSGSHGRFTFGVLVSQAVEAPLRELQTAWGGSIHSVEPHKSYHRSQWRWSIQGRDAAAFLEDVLPHLRVKYEAARVAIPCLYGVHINRRRFTEAQIAQRRDAIAFLRECNRRGEGVV